MKRFEVTIERTQTAWLECEEESEEDARQWARDVAPLSGGDFDSQGVSEYQVLEVREVEE